MPCPTFTSALLTACEKPPAISAQALREFLRRAHGAIELRRGTAAAGDRKLVRPARARRFAGLWVDRDIASHRSLYAASRIARALSASLLKNVEVQIAADGEILVRGPNVMLGYWNDEAGTRAAIPDGWFHTGDLGELDADGFLFIRGRKKELIVLSTGKKVAPTRVELLLTASPLIDQAAVFGDNQCGLIALIVPAATGLAATTDTPTEITEKFTAEISRALASAAREEQVHRFVLLDRPFSIERGEMTGKLSLCRSVIAQLRRRTEQSHLAESPHRRADHRRDRPGALKQIEN